MYKAIINRHLAISLSYLLLCLSLPSASLALPEDREKPITLEADNAEFNQLTGVSTYKGNVVVTQGTMWLKADIVIVHIKNGQIDYVEAQGKPTEFRYQPTLEKPPIDGVGQKIEYHVSDEKVHVLGDALFTQGCDKFSGENIVYNLAKDLVTADGGNTKKQVKFVIQPGTLNNTNGKPDC